MDIDEALRHLQVSRDITEDVMHEADRLGLATKAERLQVVMDTLAKAIGQLVNAKDTKY